MVPLDRFNQYYAPHNLPDSIAAPSNHCVANETRSKSRNGPSVRGARSYLWSLTSAEILALAFWVNEYLYGHRIIARDDG